MFHELTGWQCPGCGSQRMIHSLLHGDFAAAWHYNALLLILIPVLAIMLFLELTKNRFPKAYTVINSLPSILTISGAIVIWGILRNI